MSLQAIIFDVFGTVVDWRTNVARELADFFARHSFAVDAYDFADAWRRRYAPAMQQVREGHRPFATLDVLHSENLEATLQDHGIDPASVPAQDLAALTLAWHRLDPWPDAVPGLTRLKARFIIAPHSNGNIRLMIDIAKRAGLPWDAILGAELSQTYKPTPRTYTDAANFLGLAPAEICMAAAHNYDLAAARECGLATAFIPRPPEWGAGQSTDLAPTQDWDFVARDIGDLATQLGA